MYPYRRSNQRKRNRNNTARRNKGGGRRLPGSARELLPMLQPATKALAQVLAGNAKASGQFVHARNVVDRADQLVAEKQLDRMSARDREEFLEQLARLKLTVSDAEEEFGPIEVDDEDETEGDEEAPEEGGEEVDEETRRAQEEEERKRAEAEAAEERERLRRVALALMTPSAQAPEPKRGAPEHEDYLAGTEEEAPARRPRRESPSRSSSRGNGTTRRPRITLRAQERGDDEETQRGDEGVVSDG